MQAYDAGERDFGESRVQELLLKQQTLPADIRWHFIGHLQTNKVRQIVPFVHMIHSVDSVRLLEVINREAEKIGRRVKVLLEVHVAKEDTKSGFMPEEITSLNTKLSTLNYIEICGIMGMATNTDDEQIIRADFEQLAKHYNDLKLLFGEDFDTLSMGMSDDYPLAIACGSTMVRIGSSIFGYRSYQQ